MVINVIRFFITDLYCHVVTLYSAIRSMCGYSKNKELVCQRSDYINEYRLVIFIIYYDPSPPPWKLVANSMSSFLCYCHYQKGCMFIAVRSLP